MDKSQEEAAFDLGKIVALIKSCIDQGFPSDEVHGQCLRKFCKDIQQDASLLGIVVNDPHGVYDWNRFGARLIEDVENSVYTKSLKFRALFDVGIFAQRLRAVAGNSDAGQEEIDLHWKNFLTKMSIIAEFFEIEPILSEFNKMKEYGMLSASEIDVLLSTLQKTLRQRKENDKYSEIDQNKRITSDSWVVSLVRRAGDQHAFLVIEGRHAQKSLIWFSDLVNDPVKVRLENFESTQLENCELLYRCERHMMKISPADRLVYSCWSLSQATARRLIRMLESYKNSPPNFNIMGNASVVAWSSAKSSCNETGHNCYTFARKVLNDLEVDHIRLPQRLEDWLFTATGRHLPDHQSSSQTFTWLLKMGFGFGSVAVVSFILGKSCR